MCRHCDSYTMWSIKTTLHQLCAAKSSNSSNSRQFNESRCAREILYSCIDTETEMLMVRFSVFDERSHRPNIFTMKICLRRKSKANRLSMCVCIVFTLYLHCIRIQYYSMYTHSATLKLCIHEICVREF